MSTNWPHGVGRTVLPEIDSTNAEALRRAAAHTGPEWILALTQTAARGRRGREWSNPAGNFAATLLMHPTETPDRVALRSFVASLALYDAFVAVSGRTDGIALKWPNDVLVNGGKVAGILLESSGVAGQVSHLAIGIGVNLKSTPSVETLETRATRPVSLLSELGVDVSPEEFLDILAPAYAAWEHRFTTFGFSPVRDAWLTRAARLGTVITARLSNAEHTGTFETVDEAGNLVLSTAKGRMEIPAADVFF